MFTNTLPPIIMLKLCVFLTTPWRHFGNCFPRSFDFDLNLKHLLRGPASRNGGQWWSIKNRQHNDKRAPALRTIHKAVDAVTYYTQGCSRVNKLSDLTIKAPTLSLYRLRILTTKLNINDCDSRWAKWVEEGVLSGLEPRVDLSYTYDDIFGCGFNDRSISISKIASKARRSL